MAETFLSPVIGKLVELLVEHTIGEVTSLKGVRKQVKSLKDELEIIQPFLRDAEAKSERGEFSAAANVWLRQIREQADRIEDVVDHYAYHAGLSRYGNGFVASLRRASHCVRALKPRHEMASEIRDIEESLRKIKERGRSFGLRPFEQGGLSSAVDSAGVDPRIGSLFVDDDELVGIDATSKELVSCLVEGPSTRTVVSLVGEGGIGKTTLANKVYDDVAVKGHFDCHVWVTLSQSYSTEKILQMMKDQICATRDPFVGESRTVEEAIKLLRNALQAKRYVVVFDDVWQTEFWGVIKHALPSNNNGNRIIITTRNIEVANSFNETSCDIIQELKAWSQEQAWKLFCKKAFCSEFEGCCPRELRQLSREILSKCQGLPLVIVAVAGLLSKKEKTELEWRRIHDNLNFEFEENPQLTNVSKILSLSYHDLPYHLKSCFLYFGIFPEDFHICEERLYDIWIVEGFVKPKRGKSLEQVAEDYLNELISRSLVSFRTQRAGYQRWCRVHDLIREIILINADATCFARLLNKNNSKCQGESSSRLSINNATEDVLKLVGNSRIRSIFLFNMNDLNHTFVASLFKTFKLLRMLDFEGAPLDKLPKEIGNLFHLKSLSLRSTNVKKLPKSIGKLYNLQKLDVFHTLVQELPVEINKLANLQSLQAFCRGDYENESFCSNMGVAIPEGIGHLGELQKLSHVKAYPNGTGFAKELEKLKKLKVLAISNLTTETGKALGASIDKMNHLENLCLLFISEDEIFHSNCISSPPPYLRYLTLSCRLHEVPKWIPRLQNLHGLSLFCSRLSDEPLKCLKDLPNLAFLHLDNAFEGEELHFDRGFLRLKQLKLCSMKGLKAVKIDRGALPRLEDLTFGPFLLMKEMPSDIQHLPNLKSLCIVNMPREFLISLKPDGGSSYCKIQHVPSVEVWFKMSGKYYSCYKLGSSYMLQLLQEQAN